MLRLGIDENGLGSRLGPLVVTAAYGSFAGIYDEKFRARLQSSANKSKKLPKSAQATSRKNTMVGDSKALLKHGDVSAGEAWARSLGSPYSGSPLGDINGPQSLVEQILSPHIDDLQKICPQSSRSQCWDDFSPHFSATDEQLGRVSEVIQTWKRLGFELLGFRSTIVCSHQLNLNREQGIGRFDSDLGAMERLIIEAQRNEAQALDAVCGKVGGIAKYGNFFQHLNADKFSILKEERAESVYQFEKIGTVRFVRDADASDPLVMVASLVGKYLRELLMGHINQFYQNHERSLPIVSGYNDPRTNAFVEQAEPLSKKLRINPSCFQRFQGKA